MAETGVLLEAKIHRPGQIRNMVERRELERRLEEAGERLILLQATMGYGKTVFVNAYGQRGTRAQAWYHLSSLDNDLVTFAEYLAASVRVCCPAFRYELRAGKFWKEPQVLAQQLAQDFAAALLELSGQRKDAFLLDLVLDDFQEIHSEEIFLFLDGLLHHLPDGMRIILTQKSAVPQFAVKYMLSGDARIFDAQDLAFSRAELGELLEKLSKSPVSREAADAVYNCSEGWPAGVMFLGLFIRRRRLRLEPSEIGSVMQESRMYDFIMYELFRKLSFDIQRFLMRTSPLEYLSAGLCRAVTGEKDAAGILDYLFQEGLFIQKVEGKVLVYRYHALFRNFLLSQLKDEERREILNAAALYLLNTDQKEQAVAYAMESGSRAIVLKAVESSGIELIREGRMHLLESWLRFIQAEKTEYSPRALTVFGYYRLWQGKAEEGLSFLKKGIERAGLQREERLFLATAETAVRYLFAKRRFCEADSLLAGAVREYAYCFGSKKFPLQICLLWSALFCGREREAAELCASLPQEQDLLREIPGILETDRETASAAISKLERYEAAFRAVSETEQVAEQGNGEHGLLTVLAQTGAAVCPPGEQTEMISRRQTAEVLQAICAYHILLRACGAAFEDGAHEGAALEMRLDAVRERLSLICRSLAGTPYAGCARLLAGARLFAGGQRREAARCIFPAIEILGNAGMGELKLPGRVFELCRDIAVIGEENLTDRFSYDNDTERVKADSAADQHAGSVHLIAAAFGDFRIHAAETGEELRWRTKKAQECMAWLLHVRGRKATREELLSALWEADEAPANEVAALHNILSSIRRTLKPFGLENLIQCRDRLYFLEDGAVFDERVRADQLCRFIEEGDAEKTARQSRWILELAKQPYLRNIEGRWCEEARYRYETTFLKGLILSADYFAEHGRREEAICCYQSAWALSPYDESLLLRLLNCAAGPGEARRLRRLYAEIAEQMREELGTEPGSRLETAYQESLARCGQ